MSQSKVKSKLQRAAEGVGACCAWWYLVQMPWGTAAARAKALGVTERQFARYLEQVRKGKLSCERSGGCKEWMTTL